MLAAFTVASTVIGSVAANASSMRVGSTNQAGLIKNFSRMGFTPAKCIAELVANSCDAQSPKAIFKENRRFIKLIDMGIGMSEEKIGKMFDLFRSNHESERTMGVSGLGGKNALFILSKKDNVNPSTVLIFTKSPDGEYLRVTVPWATIIKEEIWDEQIAVDKMTKEEIVEFKKERETEEFQHGTTIQFEYSDLLMGLLNSQFNKSERDNITEFNTRLDIIFGHSGIDIVLEKSDGTPCVTLPKYNYFGDTEAQYYTGKNVELIEHYIDRDGKDRFIWIDRENNNDKKEIKQTAKQTKTIPESTVVHQTWKHIGTYEVFNGMRHDTKLFNEASPTKLNSASFHLSNYDEQFFVQSKNIEQLKEYCPKTKLYRNGQCITEFNIEGFNALTSRAGGAALLKTFYHRTEVHYTTVSSQDSRMDISMGIQANKNQNQRDFPKTFERMLKYLKERNYKKIDDHFDLVIENYTKQKAKATASQEAEKKRLFQEAANAMTATSVAAFVTAEVESDSDSEEEIEDSESDASSDADSVVGSEDDESSEEDDSAQPIVIADTVVIDLHVEEVQQEIPLVEPLIEHLTPKVTTTILIQLINEKFNDETDAEKLRAAYEFISNL